MDLKTWKEKLLHTLMFVAAVLAFIVGVSPDLIAGLTSLLAFMPVDSKTYLLIGFVLAALSRLPRVLPLLNELIARLKGITPATLLMLAAVNLAAPGCAWYQRNEAKIVCTAVATVEHAPELSQIVVGCAAIAVTTSAIVPCIRAAAGSQWTDDVVACFAADAAGAVQCPAASGVRKGASMSPGDRARLREAVSAEWGGRL